MKFQKVFIKIFTSKGTLVEHRTQIRFNEKLLRFNSFLIDDLSKPETLRVFISFHGFFVSDSQVDVEHKICLVIPKFLSVDLGKNWLPASWTAFYAGEMLPIRRFKLDVGTTDAKLKLEFSKRHFAIEVEEIQ